MRARANLDDDDHLCRPAFVRPDSAVQFPRKPLCCSLSSDASDDSVTLMEKESRHVTPLPRFTLGIEEEFQLVDQQTGQLSSRILTLLEKGAAQFGEKI